MSHYTDRETYVLAFARNKHGLGYVLFEGEGEPVEWGVKKCAKKDYFDAARTLLHIYDPAVLLLPAPDKRHSRSTDTIKHFLARIARCARKVDREVLRYTREEIRTCFKPYGAMTKDDIACVIAQRVPEFARCLPKKRKEWEGESRNMVLFDALSLMHVFYETKRIVEKR